MQTEVQRYWVLDYDSKVISEAKLIQFLQMET